MTDFVFNPKKNYPFILTNGTEGTVQISGISVPDDPISFFMPLQAWINDYLANQANSLTVNFELYYFTPTTSKYFFKLFQQLKSHHQNGKEIVINWYYSPEDTDILEEGEDFKEGINFPFNLISSNPLLTFNVNKTETTPLVYFDQSGDIVVQGNAKGVKPWGYFYPLIKWLEKGRFEKEINHVSADIYIQSIDELNLLYIEHILSLLELTDKKENKSVSVAWGYSSESIKDIGYEFKAKFNMSIQLYPHK
jgi:hypothetical protein